MSEAKYKQIAAKISLLIDEGCYPKGSKLPPHRVLAQELNTTAVTVAKAYQRLVEQRKVESFVGKGSFVREDRLNQVIQVSEQSSALNFSILQPCLRLHEQVLNTQFSNSFTQALDHQLLGYSESSGLLRHRKAAARWSERYGLCLIDDEQMLLTNGAQQALSALIQFYTSENDVIAVECQTYPGILSIAGYLDRKVVPIAMDEQGMLPHALAEQCQNEKPKMVIVVPSNQNPTGSTMGVSRRKKLAEVIKQNNLWLVEDEIYAFLNEETLPAISQFAPDLCFHISSLSKAVSPGLRCGFVAVPPMQRQTFSDFLRALSWLPSPVVFEVASALINSGEAFTIAEKQRDIARRRQLLVGEYLGKYSLLRQLSSFSCWLTLPSYWTSEQFVDVASQAGVLISAESFFNADDKMRGGVRLSVMAIDDENVFVTGLKKIAALLQTKGVN